MHLDSFARRGGMIEEIKQDYRDMSGGVPFTYCEGSRRREQNACELVAEGFYILIWNY